MNIINFLSVFKDWKLNFATFISLNLVKTKDILRVCSLMILVILFEIISVTAFIPLLEFLQNGGNLNFQDNSVWLKYYHKMYKFLGITPNILFLCLVIIICVSIRQFLNYISLVNTMSLKHRIGKNIAVMCFEGIVKSNSTYLRAIKSGTFVNVIDHQSQIVANIMRSFCTVFQIFITFISYFAVMIITAPYASILSIFIMSLIILSVEKWVKKSKLLSAEMVTYRQEYVSFLNDRYRNWRAIKILGTEEKEVKFVKEYAQKFFLYGVRIVKNTGKNIVIVTPLMMTAALSLLYISIEYLSMTIASISIFVLMLLRLAPVTQNLANQRTAIASAQPSFSNILKILKESQEKKENLQKGNIFKKVKNGITFENVSFTYPGTKNNTLEKINCFIPANKVTAVIGRSGAGKSTLTDLIIGLIKPNKGKIIFDIYDQETVSPASLRKSISYVSQQPLIFSGSIFDNIKYASSKATKKMVIEASKNAGAHKFIEKLPLKYGTKLSEGGANISGGERQRIMLARAFLIKNDLILLDEATSSVDVESERKINQVISKKMKEKKTTIIIIAHRVSTIKNADHILILDNGKVIDQGSPKKLMYDDSWYSKMMDAK